MGVLSAIAINLATGVAIEFWSGLGMTVEKEIKAAFNKALLDWSASKELAEAKRRDLLNFLIKSLEDEDFLKDKKESNKEYLDFKGKFRVRLAEYKTAFQYLESIKNDAQFQEEIKKLNKIEITTSDTNKKVTLLLEILGYNSHGIEKKQSLNIEQEDSRIILFNNYKEECEKFYLSRDIDKRFCKLLNLGNVWLFGKSGIGKTALISRNLLINGYETIFCDFSPVTIVNADGLIDEVAENVCEKYGIDEVYKVNNKIKNLRNHILSIDNSNIVIVIDELSIDSPELLNDITYKIVQLITYYNNSRNNSSLKFVVSTLSKPEIIKALRGKALEHFQFSEVDKWNGELNILLELINQALNNFLDDDMQKKIMEKSNNSPRLLKAIVKKLLLYDKLDIELVSHISNDTYNEHS